jgi:hypothetical protein
MGRVVEAYVTGSSRGRRLPVIFMLLAIVVATAVVAIGVVLGGGGMAVAAQGDDATIEATTFKVADGQTSEEYAKCPSNKRVVGGGVVQSGSPKGLLVHASGPLNASGTTAQTRNGDIATQWYAAVGNYSGGAVTFKVFAICSANSDATIEATSFPVPQRGTGDASAVCPPNKRVVGGGVVQSGPPASGYVAASGPLDETGTTAATQSGDTAKEWYAAVSNPVAVAGEGPLPYKVFALCSANSDATIEATSSHVGDKDSGEQYGEEYAKCPSNKRALGGGVVESGPPPLINLLYVAASGPLDETGTTAATQSGDTAKQWYAAVRNSGIRPRDLKVFAICQ